MLFKFFFKLNEKLHIVGPTNFFMPIPLTDFILSEIILRTKRLLSEDIKKDHGRTMLDRILNEGERDKIHMYQNYISFSSPINEIKKHQIFVQFKFI